MSTIKSFKTKLFSGNVEIFNSAQEVVEVGRQRNITDSSFHDMHKPDEVDSKFCGGVKTFEEAEELMKTGYQPTVDRMKKGIKANVSGQGKRIAFRNEVVGFQPIVPLALQGVPNCMVNTHMKPIKSKVLNIYYDMTASWSTSSESIIKAGQDILAAIMELEMQGYKFNLYAIQTYFDGKTADMLCTKIKSANTPMDLKRISFPLTHTAYFRVIGWDWYSRFPQGKYRSGYGHALGCDYDQKQLSEAFEQIFHEKCIYFSAAKVIKETVDTIKEVLTNADDGRKK